MIKASVLMSVYNERKEELKAALDSIFQQSFTDFELIIVCDNPSNEILKKNVVDLTKEDTRVKIIWNEENIGLALSLNKAFKASQGEYLIRMDADDICVKDRFEKQIALMEESKYDLVCSSYYYINENGDLISRRADYYTEKQIQDFLPLKNIIHHPTVVMRRDIFQKVGMYRNFPCSQDYDLWLRMLDLGCSMYMMEEKLLYYRIREQSVTSKKGFQQLSTIDYIRHIYRERNRRGVDLYDYDGYLNYIKKLGVGNQEKENNFLLARDYVRVGKESAKDKKYIKAGFHLVRGFFTSNFYRRQLFLYFQRKLKKV